MNKSKRSFSWAPYFYILPIVAIAILFRYLPFLRTIAFAFSKVNVQGNILEFVGFKNFQDLFTNRNFLNALRITLKFTVMYVPLVLVFSILLAKLAVPDQKLSRFATALIILPMTISMSAIAMIAKLLLNPSTGFINYIFDLDWGWFQDRKQALGSILLVVFWLGFPFAYLVIRAAFLHIPQTLKEAAKLDGANDFQRFIYLELPLIRPHILTIFSLSTIQALLMAGPVMVLTEGGPVRSTTTLIFMMYTSGYQSSNYALSASIALFTFALTLIFTLLIFFSRRKRVNSV